MAEAAEPSAAVPDMDEDAMMASMQLDLSKKKKKKKKKKTEEGEEGAAAVVSDGRQYANYSYDEVRTRPASAATGPTPA